MAESSDDERSDTVRFVVEDEAHLALKRRMLEEANKLPAAWKPQENAKRLKEDSFAQKNRSAKHIFKKLELSEQDEQEEYGSSLSSTLEHLLGQSLPREETSASPEQPKAEKQNKSCSPATSSRSSSPSPMKAVNTKDIRRLQRKAKKRRHSSDIAKILDEEEPLDFRSQSQGKSTANAFKAKPKRRKRRLLNPPLQASSKSSLSALESKFQAKKPKTSKKARGDEQETVTLSSQLAKFASSSRSQAKRSPKKPVIKKEKVSPRRRTTIPTIPENDEIVDLVEDDIFTSPPKPNQDVDVEVEAEQTGTASEWLGNPSQTRQILTPAFAEASSSTVPPSLNKGSRMLKFGSSMKKSYVKDFRRRSVKGKKPSFRLSGQTRILDWYDLASQRLSKSLGEMAHWSMKEESAEDTGLELDPFSRNYIRVLVLVADSDAHLFMLKCSLLDTSACAATGSIVIPPKTELTLIIERPVPSTSKSTRAKHFRTLETLGHLEGIRSSADFTGKCLKVFAPWTYAPATNALICSSLVLNQGPSQTDTIPPSPAPSMRPKRRRKWRICAEIEPVPKSLPSLNDHGLLQAKALVGPCRVDVLKGVVLCCIPRDYVPLDSLSVDKCVDGVPPGTICSSILLRLDKATDGSAKHCAPFVELLVSPLLFHRFRNLLEAPCGSRVTLRGGCLVALPLWSTQDDASTVDWESLYAFTKQAKDGSHWTLNADESTSFELEECAAESVTEVITPVSRIVELLRITSVQKRVSVVGKVTRVTETVLGVASASGDISTALNAFEVLLQEDRTKAVIHRFARPGSFVLLKHLCVTRGECKTDGVSVVELLEPSDESLPNPSFIMSDASGNTIAWARKRRDEENDGLVPLDTSGTKLNNSIIQSVPAAKTHACCFTRLVTSKDFHSQKHEQ